MDDTNDKLVKVPNLRTKLVKYELEERRKKILKLRLRGLSVTSIAKILNVSPSLVSNDLKKVRKENKTFVDKIDQNEFIGESLAIFDEVQERAWSEYQSSKAGTPQRLKALDLVRTVQKDKVDVLTDVGLIGEEDAPLEVEHVHRLEWTPEIQERVARALIEQSLTTVLPEPIPDEPAYIEEGEIVNENSEEEKEENR